MLYAFDFHYAGLTIDAAQDNEGNIWISTPTIQNLLGYTKNSTSRISASDSFKAFTGQGFELLKTKQKSTKYNNTNVYYSKETFLKFVYFEVSKGNQQAINLVVSGFVADFEGSIQSALGNQLSEEQREYLRQLVFNRLQAFRAWTDIIRDRYLEFYGQKPDGWYYGKLIKEANLYLFGVENFGSDRTANMTTEQQKLIVEFESMLARQAKKHPNFDPEALMRHTLEVCF